MKTFLLAVIFASAAIAQPPNVIRIVRNTPIQPYYGKSNINVVGMSVFTGIPETWLLELHDSYGSLEDLDKALNVAGSEVFPGAGYVPGDDILPSSKTITASYRPELSYRPDQAFQTFPKMRYLDVQICRVSPNQEREFSKSLQAREFGLDSINQDRPEIVYRVVSGAPSGTYVLLSPLTSLRQLDDLRTRTPVYAEAAVSAAKQSAAQLDVAREHLWFRVEPTMSYVTEDFASQDSGFWHPKK